MTIRNPTQSGRLKSAILKGVYDENLRIDGDLPPADRNGQILTKRKKKALTGSLLFLAVFLLLASLYLDVLNFREQPATIAGRTTAQTEFSLGETGVVEMSAPALLPAYSSAQESYILRQPGIEPVELNAEKLLDYSIILNNANVRLSSVFGLDVQTIVIDPGHGGKDPGAIGALGTKEKDIVLDIALGLRDKLEESGKYKVVLTRDSDVTMSLTERVEFANSGRTDLFISLHVNALPQKRENLIETYYYGPPQDEETLRLAEQENRGSGLLTRDFENMIKKIGNTFKEQESATLASSIQHSLFTNVKKYDKDIADAGIKIAPFVVLLGVDAPSVLVEISCITKKQEELKLNMPAYRDEITSFLAEGTTRYLARRNLHVLKGVENGQKERSKSS
ncbi:MAG: N-acetylmuramoyl-L-alanine amidase [Desulfobulbaceae bacterium]|nr:N-acetylmuramoyl-L-alanine amidase [Desulfobulbaceae bacterium]